MNKITCPHCSNTVDPLSFCPHCGVSLNKEKTSISSYEIIKSLGKGGMGEVLLAFDNICQRKIALKKIREDLVKYKQVTQRFLKEAHITAQLTHPAIIPIYSIVQDEKNSYYTMPYVQGKTLKQILNEAKEGEKKGEKEAGSIPYLIHIFLSICQAIAYAHSRSILHRDIKPENVMVGTYGEVMILDWGLAKHLSEHASSDLEEVKISSPRHTTLLGKVVGTIGYMAPERALGQPAAKGTDIYSLGVILYQILTLKMPFRRKNLKYYREHMHREVLHDPIEIAPYRDIPNALAQMTLKCLSPDPSMRYASVDSIIYDLRNYIEGRADWLQIAELRVENKTDWEFQEHVLIAEHTAITRSAEISEWVKLMISSLSFSENIKIETEFFPSKGCQGIGILFNVPESIQRNQINDGFCLWISTEAVRSTTLFRDGIEVLSIPDCFIKEGEPCYFSLQKVDNTIRFYLNSEEQFTYIARMPKIGTHIGILSRDDMFHISEIKVSVGSQNIMVNCLAIPDAFLAEKNYDKALSEYRRISSAFSGRAEGREAVLRAGITLLEEAKNEQAPALYDAALLEFEKLHRTPGAPLEYLGKALVYESLGDYDEEVKCFELAHRKYPHHPLRHMLHDQILFRLLESSRSDRKAVYQFLLLALMHFQTPLAIPSLKNLVNYLKIHWEPIEFLPPSVLEEIPQLVLTLAFWTHKNYILEENAKEGALESSLILLLALNEKELVHEILSQLPISAYLKERKSLAPLLIDDLDAGFKLIQDTGNPIFLLFLDAAIDQKRHDLVERAFTSLNPVMTDALLARRLFALLQSGDLKKTEALIHSIPKEKLLSEASILHYLYGCWILATQGMEKAKRHFGTVLEVPFPRSFTLGSLYMTGKLDPSWYKRAFDWERWQLQRQLALIDVLKQRLVK